MNARKTAFCVFAVTIATSVCATADDEVTAKLDGIRLNTVAPVALSSAEEISALWPVTYRAGETVVATGPDGTSVPLVATPAETSGTVVFSPDSSGVWRLANSSGDEAVFGVAWSVFGGGEPQDFPFDQPCAIHTKDEGPYRRCGTGRDLPPVAYSGDDWLGDASAAVSLTFTSPSGVVTQLDRTGTGTQSFTFGETGLWTIVMVMSDSTERVAQVRIAGGFVLIIS